MALYNFVDLVGPPVPALYLNELDLIRQGLSATSSGAFAIARPTADVSALTISPKGTSDALTIVSQAGGGNTAQIQLFATGYGAYSLAAKNQTGNNLVLRDTVAAADRLSLADTGLFTFHAATSGMYSVLIHNRAGAGAAALALRAGSTAFYAYQIFENSAGTRRMELLAVGSASGSVYGIPADSAGINGLTGLHFATNDAVRMSIIAAGGVFIATPTSGDTLTLGPSPSTGVLIATSAALTTGAGASAGTLTNAPSAGDPTKWIKINDNGTVRAVPAW